MSKLTLLNLLKKEISEQGYGHYFRDWKTSDGKTVGDYRGFDFTTNKPFDKNYKNNPIDDEDTDQNEIETSETSVKIDDLNSSNFTKLGTKRGATYGWRYWQTATLCGPGKRKRYCDWHWHAGRDYSFGYGRKIGILQSGTIVDKGTMCFSILHHNGNRTKYCHCQKVFFENGESVKPGDIVAEVGNVGISSGAHLHWEIHPKGVEPKTVSHASVTPGKTQYANQDDVDPKDYEDKYVVIVNDVSKFKADVKSKLSKITINQNDDDDDDDDQSTNQIIGGKTVVFGGMYYATPEWMKSQWVAAGLPVNKAIFLSYTSTELSKVKKNNKIDKIVGFSAGGTDVWNEIMSNSSEYTFMGLIDPSTSQDAFEKYKDGGLPSKVKSLSNSANWTGKNAKIGVRLKKLEDSGVLTKTNSFHENIPLEFFKKYKTNLS